MSITAGLNVFGANRDIASEINKAAATGNYVLAAQLEVERNRKVAEMDSGGLNNYNYFQTQAFQQPQQPVQQPIPQPVQQPQQAESDLFALQEKRRLQALEASRRNALSSLGAERGQVNPTYNNALSNVAGQSALGARNLAEYMAQRGLTNSGASVQGEVMRQGSLQNNMTSLEADRANWMADIGRRETLANSAYDEGSLQASMQRGESELESKLRMMEQQRAESIGTVGQYGQDYAAEINAIQAEMARGDNSRAYLLPYLKIARQEKVANMPIVDTVVPVSAVGTRSVVPTKPTTTSTPVPTNTASVSGDYNSVVLNVKRALSGTNASSPSSWNAVVTYVQSAMANGIINEAQASQILASVGLL